MSNITDEQLDKMIRTITESHDKCSAEYQCVSLGEYKTLRDNFEDYVLSQKTQQILKNYIISNRVLRREVNELKDSVKDLKEEINNLKRQRDKQNALYNDILKVIEPYMGDFTGYDEKLGGFNIVLAVKELLEEGDQAVEITIPSFSVNVPVVTARNKTAKGAVEKLKGVKNE